MANGERYVRIECNERQKGRPAQLTCCICMAQCKNVRANCIQIIAYCQAHTAYAYYYNVYAKERNKKEMIDSHCSPPVVVCIREKCISLHILAAPSNCHTHTHTHTGKLCNLMQMAGGHSNCRPCVPQKHKTFVLVPGKRLRVNSHEMRIKYRPERGARGAPPQRFG